MASRTVYEIFRLDLQGLETSASASIITVKPLSSYKWIEAPNSTPATAVPGRPALCSASGVTTSSERREHHPVSIQKNAFYKFVLPLLHSISLTATDEERQNSFSSITKVTAHKTLPEIQQFPTIHIFSNIA